jgi:hypothetical protein
MTAATSAQRIAVRLIGGKGHRAMNIRNAMTIKGHITHSRGMNLSKRSGFTG